MFNVRKRYLPIAIIMFFLTIIFFSPTANSATESTSVVTDFDESHGVVAVSYHEDTDSATVYIVPKVGYVISEVTLNAKNVPITGDSLHAHTLSLPSGEHTVSVEFMQVSVVTLLHNKGGTIQIEGEEYSSPSDNLLLPIDKEITVITTPLDGYELKSLTANGVLTDNTLTITGNTTSIVALFEEQSPLNYTTAEGDNGTVTWLPSEEGALLFVKPDEGYYTDSIAINAEYIDSIPQGSRFDTENGFSYFYKAQEDDTTVTATAVFKSAVTVKLSAKDENGADLQQSVAIDFSDDFTMIDGVYYSPSLADCEFTITYDNALYPNMSIPTTVTKVGDNTYSLATPESGPLEETIVFIEALAPSYINHSIVGGGSVEYLPSLSNSSVAMLRVTADSGNELSEIKVGRSSVLHQAIGYGGAFDGASAIVSIPQPAGNSVTITFSAIDPNIAVHNITTDTPVTIPARVTDGGLIDIWYEYDGRYRLKKVILSTTGGDEIASSTPNEVTADIAFARLTLPMLSQEYDLVVTAEFTEMFTVDYGGLTGGKATVISSGDYTTYVEGLQCPVGSTVSLQLTADEGYKLNGPSELTLTTDTVLKNLELFTPNITVTGDVEYDISAVAETTSVHIKSEKPISSITTSDFSAVFSDTLSVFELYVPIESGDNLTVDTWSLAALDIPIANGEITLLSGGVVKDGLHHLAIQNNIASADILLLFTADSGYVTENGGSGVLLTIPEGEPVTITAPEFAKQTQKKVILADGMAEPPLLTIDGDTSQNYGIFEVEVGEDIYLTASQALSSGYLIVGYYADSVYTPTDGFGAVNIVVPSDVISVRLLYSPFSDMVVTDTYSIVASGDESIVIPNQGYRLDRVTADGDELLPAISFSEDYPQHFDGITLPDYDDIEITTKQISLITHDADGETVSFEGVYSHRGVLMCDVGSVFTVKSDEVYIIVQSTNTVEELTPYRAYSVLADTANTHLTVQTISALHKVTSTTEGEGEITHPTLIHNGGSVTVSVTPSDGFYAAEMFVNGVRSEVSLTEEIVISPVTEDIAIHVVYKRVGVEIITDLSNVDVTFSPYVTDKESYAYLYDRITFTVKADDGYSLHSVFINGAPITLTVDGTFEWEVTSDAPLRVTAAAILSHSRNTLDWLTLFTEVTAKPLTFDHYQNDIEVATKLQQLFDNYDALTQEEKVLVTLEYSGVVQPLSDLMLLYHSLLEVQNLIDDIPTFTAYDVMSEYKVMEAYMRYSLLGSEAELYLSDSHKQKLAEALQDILTYEADIYSYHKVIQYIDSLPDIDDVEADDAEALLAEALLIELRYSFLSGIDKGSVVNYLTLSSFIDETENMLASLDNVENSDIVGELHDEIESLQVRTSASDNQADFDSFFTLLQSCVTQYINLTDEQQTILEHDYNIGDTSSADYLMGLWDTYKGGIENAEGDVPVYTNDSGVTVEKVPAEESMLNGMEILHSLSITDGGEYSGSFVMEVACKDDTVSAVLFTEGGEEYPLSIACTEDTILILCPTVGKVAVYDEEVPTVNSSLLELVSAPTVSSERVSSFWVEVLTDLENAPEGDTIIVDMPFYTRVPSDIIEYIDGTDLSILFYLPDGELLINGLELPRLMEGASSYTLSELGYNTKPTASLLSANTLLGITPTDNIPLQQEMIATPMSEVPTEPMTVQNVATTEQSTTPTDDSTDRQTPPTAIPAIAPFTPQQTTNTPLNFGDYLPIVFATTTLNSVLFGLMLFAYHRFQNK